MATYDQGHAPQTGAARGQGFVNVVGAVVSLSLIIGVGYWGYQLIMRDVSGIPVVRAMEGEMRVLPDDPGGDIAGNAGLAINELVAQGEAAGPEDRLVLAPVTQGLAQEDMATPTAMVVDDITDQTMIPNAVLPGTAEAAASTNATVDDVLAMVADITAEEEAEEVAAMDRLPASVHGVAVSLRPIVRPASLRPASAAAPAPAQAAPVATPVTDVSVTTTDFAVGTDLVQLGAFSTAELAAEEWNRLQSRFGSLMNGRNRVVQVSNQTSGTWYRLRASGFADRDDARRFCAALEAEGAECIAVVVN
ncbi:MULTISPECIES: SPOR domain-containing protein [unclassified Yoonia]|uniref:SPOR domain-containing protein n=1 Tax=unclassified Yoonia TaxID=2629118 RepID=UPI002AFE6492|nr:MULTISPECIES: SPOR domain-containing protein [unclassified Yoonia]